MVSIPEVTFANFALLVWSRLVALKLLVMASISATRKKNSGATGQNCPGVVLVMVVIASILTGIHCITSDLPATLYVSNARSNTPCSAGAYKNPRKWKSLFPNHALPLMVKALVSIPIAAGAIGTITKLVKVMGHKAFDYIFFAYDYVVVQLC